MVGLAVRGGPIYGGFANFAVVKDLKGRATESAKIAI